MNGRKLIVATNNKHKLDELSVIAGSAFSIFGVSHVAPGLKWDETGTTFLDNARIKISALRPYTAGCILADDSGLCVDALKGAPGVNSSSFGGVEGDHSRNVDKLLECMRGIPVELRGAYFYCLLLFVDESGSESVFEGRCYGRIAEHRTGQAGFGYDPVFIPDGFQISMAEMTDDQKNAVSHRGLAMAMFMSARPVG